MDILRPIAVPRHRTPPRVFGAKSRRQVSRKQMLANLQRAFAELGKKPAAPGLRDMTASMRAANQRVQRQRRSAPNPKLTAPASQPRPRAPRAPRGLIAAGRDVEGSHDDGGGSGDGDGGGSSDPPPSRRRRRVHEHERDGGRL